MKKHKILLSILAVTIAFISTNALADVELKTVMVDLPTMKGTYNVGTVIKNYRSNQSYKCSSNRSNHNINDTYPVEVNLHNVGTGNKTGFVIVRIGDTYTFSGDAYINQGTYKLEIKNNRWSMYTYYTTGIWQYSM